MKSCLPTIGGIAVFAFFGIQPALARLPFDLVPAPVTRTLRGRLKGNFSSIASLRGGRSIFPHLAGKVI